MTHFTVLMIAMFRVRTAVNVLGDAFGAAIVAHLSRHELDTMGEDASEHEMKEVEERRLLADIEEGKQQTGEKTILAETESSPKSYSSSTGRAKLRCVDM